MDFSIILLINPELMLLINPAVHHPNPSGRPSHNRSGCSLSFLKGGVKGEVKKRAAKKLAAQYLLLTKINILDQFNVNGIHTFFTFLQVKFYTVAFFNVID